MHTGYEDILSRIDVAPRWWDEHAVPRFCAFSPDQIADIYADECVLLLIECQDCHKPYKVCMSISAISKMMSRMDFNYKMRTSVETHRYLYYGDPPNACEEDCCAGATMSSVSIRILEFWERSFTPEHWGWRRVPELEIEIEEEDARSGVSH